MESVDDPILTRMSRLDALRRSRAQEVNDEENEIEGLSKKLHKKNHKSHGHKLHHEDSAEDLDAAQDNAEEGSPLMKKAQNLHKEIKSLHGKQDSKKTHLHVKKNAKKAAKKADMDAEEDSDMEEPIAHEKTSKKSVARDADSTDATDSLDNEGKS